MSEHGGRDRDRLPDRLRPWASAEREAEDDAPDATGSGDEPRVIIPPRRATPAMAFFAIGVIFFIGVAVGFVLAKTL